MRAIRLDPVQRKIEVIDEDLSLMNLQAWVGGYIENVGLHPYTVYADEEGRMKHPKHFFMIHDVTIGLIAGRGIIVGIKDGETCDLDTGLEFIRERLLWVESELPSD